jgi:hypothetical protein
MRKNAVMVVEGWSWRWKEMIEFKAVITLHRSKYVIGSGPSFLVLCGITTHRRAFYQTFFLVGILLNSVRWRGILSNNRLF